MTGEPEAALRFHRPRPGFLGAARRTVLRLLLLPGLRRAYVPALRGAAIVFMLHRFADPERGVRGHDPAHLDACLRWLRREGRPILPLEDLVRRGREGRDVPPGAVAFTVDDGYYDFFRRALPVFAEHGAPVTVFAPTGFVDGDCWLWWDKIEYLVRRTEYTTLPWPDGDGPALPVSDRADRRAAVGRLVEEMERNSERDRKRVLRRLEDAAGLDVPDRPPREYRPLTWDQMREAEEEGARFGPHSITHPVLSMTTKDDLRREIGGSWRRLRAELRHPVPVFGYPFGQEWAFGDREVRAVRESGLIGAVSTRSGYAEMKAMAGTSRYRWALPRLGFPNAKEMFVQVATGLLRLRYLAADGPKEVASVYLED